LQIEFSPGLSATIPEDGEARMKALQEIGTSSQGGRVIVQRVLRADARRNRESVLVAAKKLFADQGLEAQMPDVAKAAKVGVGTVYRHFPTKEALIAALVAERFERLADKAREEIEADDPWEGFCNLIRFSAQIQVDDRALCDVMGSRPDLMEAAASEVGLPDLADQLVTRAQQSGQLRADLEWEDVPMIACGLGQIIHAAVGPASGRWPRLLELILDGLRAPGHGQLPQVMAMDGLHPGATP
jgi:AcrR family transcriptional regulator